MGAGGWDSQGVRGNPTSPLPLLGLVSLGIFDVTIHAFASAFQRVMAAGVGVALTESLPVAPSGRFAALLLLDLRLTCGVMGDANLPPHLGGGDPGEGAHGGARRPQPYPTEEGPFLP